MLVSETFGWIIIIVIGVLALVGTGLFLTKLKAHPNLYILAIGIGMLSGFIVYCNTTCVVEVKADGSYIVLMGFGHSEYTAADSQKISVSRQDDGDDTFIINGTSQMMCLETISYGNNPLMFFDFGPRLIPSHTTMETSIEPDYFPHQQPPNQVSVTKGQESDSKYWLRYGD